MKARAFLLPAAAAMLAQGCTLNRVQNALHPAGSQARALESFWWFAFWVALAVYVAVMIAFAVATGRRGPAEPAQVLRPAAVQEEKSTRWVTIATAATILILLSFLVIDLATSRSLGAMQRDESALEVNVTGYQWWWRVEYPDSVPSRTVVTANELHIPVGRTIEVQLEAGDVIHSFWIPALGGKRDMVPGLRNRLWLRADSAGVYRGECAEFCGHQHAKMAFTVVAHDSAEFAAWYNQQLQPAVMPSDTLRQQGMNVFLGRSCAMCHAVRGTPAGGQVAPDLTHIASRRTVAAGTLPNTRGHLAGWILDPQSSKPGVRMPPNALSGPELQALLAYLEGLK